MMLNSQRIKTCTKLIFIFHWHWQVTKRVETPEGQWKGWNWRSEGDLYLNGAYFTASGAGASASYARASSLGAKSSAMVGTITSNAGALGCKRGRQC
jgi:pectate lyase